jgi:hypothetical protein
MNYDTKYNIYEHKLQIVVDDTGDIFINTVDYSFREDEGRIIEVCSLTRDDTHSLIEILHKAVDRSKEIANDK